MTRFVRIIIGIMEDWSRS